MDSNQGHTFTEEQLARIAQLHQEGTERLNSGFPEATSFRPLKTYLKSITGSEVHDLNALLQDNSPQHGVAEPEGQTTDPTPVINMPDPVVITPTDPIETPSIEIEPINAEGFDVPTVEHMEVEAITVDLADIEPVVADTEPVTVPEPEPFVEKLPDTEPEQPAPPVQKNETVLEDLADDVFEIPVEMLQDLGLEDAATAPQQPEDSNKEQATSEDPLDELFDDLEGEDDQPEPAPQPGLERAKIRTFDPAKVVSQLKDLGSGITIETTPNYFIIEKKPAIGEFFNAGVSVIVLLVVLFGTGFGAFIKFLVFLFLGYRVFKSLSRSSRIKVDLNHEQLDFWERRGTTKEYRHSIDPATVGFVRRKGGKKNKEVIFWLNGNNGNQKFDLLDISSPSVKDEITKVIRDNYGWPMEELLPD